MHPACRPGRAACAPHLRTSRAYRAGWLRRGRRHSGFEGKPVARAGARHLSATGPEAKPGGKEKACGNACAAGAPVGRSTIPTPAPGLDRARGITAQDAPPPLRDAGRPRRPAPSPLCFRRLGSHPRPQLCFRRLGSHTPPTALLTALGSPAPTPCPFTALLLAARAVRGVWGPRRALLGGARGREPPRGDLKREPPRGDLTETKRRTTSRSRRCSSRPGC